MKYVVQSTLLILLVCCCNLGYAQDLTLICPESFEKEELFPVSDGDPLYGAASLLLPEVTTECRRKKITFTWLVDGESIEIDVNNLPVVEGFTTHNIVIVASDACGNSESCFYDITITRPDLNYGFENCPEDILIYVLPEETGAVANYNPPPFINNCSEQAQFTLPPDELESGNIFPLGTTSVSFIANTDVCGETSCVFDITVEVGDLVIDCPESFTKAEEFPDAPTADFGIASVISPVVSTNCPISDEVTVSLLEIEKYTLLGNNEFTISGFQTHLIQFEISDACGNVDTCSYEITITKPETEIGFLDCPTDTIVVELERFQASAVVEYETPQIFSNCFFDPEFLSDSNNKGSGSQFSPGFYTERFTLMAPCGGTSCELYIDVRYEDGPLVEFVDCPEDFTKTETSPIDPMDDPLYGLARVIEPALFSACELGEEAFLISPSNITTIDGEDYVSGFGTYEVIFIGVGRACGTPDTCSYNITIERPEIVFEIENCPMDTMINLEDGETEIVFDYQLPNLNTNCGSGGILTPDPNNIGPGGIFPLGMNVERFTATGECGEVVCEFKVIVVGGSTNLNVICPDRISIREDAISLGQADYGIAVIIEPEISTDCPDPTISIEILNEDIIFYEFQSAVSGFQEHDIIFRITDNCGNVEICNYVIDISRPDFVYEIGFCPSDQVITVPAGAGGAVVEFAPPQLAGNCPDPDITLSSVPADALGSGDFFPLGTTTISYIFSSPFCGNASCEFNVTIEEEEVEESEGVDLELSLSTEAVALERFTSGDFQFTLRNNGTENATGIEVLLDFDMNEIVPVGNLHPEPSKGEYRVVPRSWMIDELAAGESATLDIKMFAKMAGASFITQVNAQDQEDADSTPANAACCMANEDDEVYFKAIIVEPPFILTCPDSFVKMDVLPLSLDDELFGKAIIPFPEAISTSCIDTTVTVELLTTENVVEMNGVLVVEGFMVHELDFLISDACGNEESCSYTIRITMPDLFFRYAYCPEDIVIPVRPGTTDALVNYPEPIFQTNCPDPAREGLVDSSLPSGSFFPLGRTTVEYAADSDMCGMTICSFDVIVEEYIHAGTDLSLEVEVDNFMVRPYEPTNTAFTVYNSSGTDATGVQFKLNLQSNLLVQVGDSDASPTQGSYNEFTGFWDVGTVTAGDSAKLILELYVAEEESATIFAQIISQNEADNDSAPANAVCCTANEDDEAAFTLLGERIIDFAELREPDVGGTMQVQLYPNPAHEKLEIFYPFEHIAHTYLIFDLNGRIIQRGTLQAETSQFTIDISVLQKGMYYLKIDTEDAPVPIRFVKI